MFHHDLAVSDPSIGTNHWNLKPSGILPVLKIGIGEALVSLRDPTVFETAASRLIWTVSELESNLPLSI